MVFIQGNGSSQKSAASVIGGRIFDDDNIQTASISGFMSGSSMTASNGATNGSLFFDSDVQTIRDGLGASGAAFYGVSAPNAFVLGSLQPSAGLGAEELDVEAGGTGVFFRPNVITLSETGPEALPSSRTARTLNGYSGGLSQDINSTGGVDSNDFFKNEGSSPDDIEIVTDPLTDSLTATLDVDSPGGPQIESFQGGTSFGHSLFVDDDTFGTIENGTSLVGGLTSESHDYLTTFDRLDSSGFLPSGVTFCVCQFLAWGFWGIDINNISVDDARVHLAQWVAGELATDTQISALSGTASYAGHAIATVKNGSDVYSAVGNFSMSVNVGAPGSSTFSITDFDGGSFNDNGSGLSFSGSGGLNIFDGTLLGQGVHAGVDGSMRGSFAKGGGSNAAEAGAHWEVTDGTYTAGGIIAAAASAAP